MKEKFTRAENKQAQITIDKTKYDRLKSIETNEAMKIPIIKDRERTLNQRNGASPLFVIVSTINYCSSFRLGSA